MARVMVVGAGGVGNVVVHKCAAQQEFSEILLASRTLEKCRRIAERVQSPKVKVVSLDADYVNNTVEVLKEFRPDILINVALPYQDLALMDACLEVGVNYLDTANYEPPDEAKFEYSWQWKYHEPYKQAGITAILGCGFDPGVTGVFSAYALKHYFDEIHYLDIVDCNAGNHGQVFATNFNPEINIREITQNGRYYENGRWVEVPPLSIHRPIPYPEIGERESYLLYHEELESLVKHIPTLKRARFWMTFSQSYITHLQVLQNIGMTRIDPVDYEGFKVVPLKFLKSLLPDPSSLAQDYTGQTSIGCYIRGVKEGKERSYYVYNNCDHAQTYQEVGAQAIAYTTGVPAVIGALMVVNGFWKQPGVFNVEQCDPDPFMKLLGPLGLSWHEVIDGTSPFEKE
ncbi:saccharopine dehydrogenase [Nostoc linckia z18]|uniref:Saccharopine dehydrogenase n=3 Tax=Nostoc TaxID=1177 RepID=A0A9Q6EMI0_NOSLI|nr:saccharopine dehydrogenase family protein [Nostoc linckia]MBD2614738.1 saccharopine dehydrogenase family protein [Nostoc punctiforme FACHB-252]PHJ58338.1 saccharopine dehydrogenase [Nostoc linckia z1]PHJ60908.1 saccharopine dehydrogenase [Nostoc linckia z2]PHJ67090.1 saccharopine dehydrogenase [Nostoc linckia z3]PHJ81641.1 saccharopine dehydrogenase [Nostoc linckia z4]PHJ90059.1 saccharopine dehydrogenase [Nostoc linckia z7]PHK04619.1 saccharopine dehydrogenase [Nostoc linckia z9]PHK0591